MPEVISIDPRTGLQRDVVAEETTPHELDRLCGQADVAAPMLEDAGRGFRARMLRAMADSLEKRRDDIVLLADSETAIGSARLGAELTRTCYQMRFFADVLDEGSYLEATVDHATDTPMGARPDVRRMLVPIGPVAVFGASNFPLAFSVPGGDTVSALAAGSPVVVKAHGSHPATSALCFRVLDDTVRRVGAPDGTISLVHGVDAGANLVAHPAIRAVGFTGSLSGGRALLDIINRRPDPIPFYGEMGSINPVVVTPAAARERAQEIASGLVASFTGGGGQLCTKPGLVLVPAGDDGDRLVAGMESALADVPGQVLLNDRIHKAFVDGTRRLSSARGVETVRGALPAAGVGNAVTPWLLTVPADQLGPDVIEECFGPVAVVARYDGDDGLQRALRSLPGSLTTSVHVGSDAAATIELLSPTLRRLAGRIIFNGYPTGVSVSWAQHHGGPWPSTNSLHTSVGGTAIRRWLRPITWQNAPSEALPKELRDDFGQIPRRVDGQLVLP